MDVTRRVEGISIFKNDNESHDSQEKVLSERTKFFETIQIFKKGQILISISIQCK